MKILGIEGKSAAQVQAAVREGGRFVIFGYCVSLLVITLKRSSNVHFVPAGRNTLSRSWPFTRISLVAGWWGIPWGPIYTIPTIAQNVGGGRDVTSQILAGGSNAGAIAPSRRPEAQVAASRNP